MNTLVSVSTYVLILLSQGCCQEKDSDKEISSALFITEFYHASNYEAK